MKDDTPFNCVTFGGYGIGFGDRDYEKELCGRLIDSDVNREVYNNEVFANRFPRRYGPFGDVYYGELKDLSLLDSLHALLLGQSFSPLRENRMITVIGRIFKALVLSFVPTLVLYWVSTIFRCHHTVSADFKMETTDVIKEMEAELSKTIEFEQTGTVSIGSNVNSTVESARLVRYLAQVYLYLIDDVVIHVLRNIHWDIVFHSVTTQSILTLFFYGWSCTFLPILTMHRRADLLRVMLIVSVLNIAMGYGALIFLPRFSKFMVSFVAELVSHIVRGLFLTVLPTLGIKSYCDFLYSELQSAAIEKDSIGTESSYCWTEVASSTKESLRLEKSPPKGTNPFTPERGSILELRTPKKTDHSNLESSSNPQSDPASNQRSKPATNPRSDPKSTSFSSGSNDSDAKGPRCEFPNVSDIADNPKTEAAGNQKTSDNAVSNVKSAMPSPMPNADTILSVSDHPGDGIPDKGQHGANPDEAQHNVTSAADRSTAGTANIWEADHALDGETGEANGRSAGNLFIDSEHTICDFFIDGERSMDSNAADLMAELPAKHSMPEQSADLTLVGSLVRLQLESTPVLHGENDGSEAFHPTSLMESKNADEVNGHQYRSQHGEDGNQLGQNGSDENGTAISNDHWDGITHSNEQHQQNVRMKYSQIHAETMRPSGKGVSFFPGSDKRPPSRNQSRDASDGASNAGVSNVDSMESWKRKIRETRKVMGRSPSPDSSVHSSPDGNVTLGKVLQLFYQIVTGRVNGNPGSIPGANENTGNAGAGSSNHPSPGVTPGVTRASDLYDSLIMTAHYGFLTMVAVSFRYLLETVFEVFTIPAVRDGVTPLMALAIIATFFSLVVPCYSKIMAFLAQNAILHYSDFLKLEDSYVAKIKGNFSQKQQLEKERKPRKVSRSFSRKEDSRSSSSRQSSDTKSSGSDSGRQKSSEENGGEESKPTQKNVRGASRSTEKSVRTSKSTEVNGSNTKSRGANPSNTKSGEADASNIEGKHADQFPRDDANVTPFSPMTSSDYHSNGEENAKYFGKKHGKHADGRRGSAGDDSNRSNTSSRGRNSTDNGSNTSLGLQRSKGSPSTAGERSNRSIVQEKDGMEMFPLEKKIELHCARVRFIVDMYIDCIRYFYGRGLVVAVSEDWLFALIAAKDYFYNTWTFGIKFSEILIVTSVKAFHPEGRRQFGDFVRTIIWLVERFIIFESLFVWLSCCWTITADFRVLSLCPEAIEEAFNLQEELSKRARIVSSDRYIRDRARKMSRNILKSTMSSQTRTETTTKASNKATPGGSTKNRNSDNSQAEIPRRSGHPRDDGSIGTSNNPNAKSNSVVGATKETTGKTKGKSVEGENIKENKGKSVETTQGENKGTAHPSHENDDRIPSEEFEGVHKACDQCEGMHMHIDNEEEAHRSEEDDTHHAYGSEEEDDTHHQMFHSEESRHRIDLQFEGVHSSDPIIEFEYLMQVPAENNSNGSRNNGAGQNGARRPTSRRRRKVLSAPDSLTIMDTIIELPETRNKFIMHFCNYKMVVRNMPEHFHWTPQDLYAALDGDSPGRGFDASSCDEKDSPKDGSPPGGASFGVKNSCRSSGAPFGVENSGNSSMHSSVEKSSRGSLSELAVRSPAGSTFFTKRKAGSTTGTGKSSSEKEIDKRNKAKVIDKRGRATDVDELKGRSSETNQKKQSRAEKYLGISHRDTYLIQRIREIVRDNILLRYQARIVLKMLCSVSYIWINLIARSCFAEKRYNIWAFAMAELYASDLVYKRLILFLVDVVEIPTVLYLQHGRHIWQEIRTTMSLAFSPSTDNATWSGLPKAICRKFVNLLGLRSICCVCRKSNRTPVEPATEVIATTPGANSRGNSNGKGGGNLDSDFRMYSKRVSFFSAVVSSLVTFIVIQSLTFSLINLHNNSDGYNSEKLREHFITRTDLIFQSARVKEAIRELQDVNNGASSGGIRNATGIAAGIQNQNQREDVENEQHANDILSSFQALEQSDGVGRDIILPDSIDENYIRNEVFLTARIDELCK